MTIHAGLGTKPVSRSSSQLPFKVEAVEMTPSMRSVDVEHQNSGPVSHHDNVDSYFIGPRDLSHHSRWPTFLRIHGSVLPRMVLPVAFVAAWSSAVTSVSILVHDIGINYVLLTVMGFVVGLSLSFRSSTAYERYNDGRKYWAQLNQITQNLARLIWIHADERPGNATEDLLAKITFCNLLASFAVALKHRLRFEPFTHYEDLEPRLRHLPILARGAVRRDWTEPSFWKKAGLVLGLPMAESNPRKLVKNPKKPLGNVPLEILASASAYLKTIIDNGTFKAPAYQTQSLALVSQMHDILTGTDRVLNTPMPIAYSIAISQITWVYILVLPFQLTNYLRWATIPATVFAAYIILGISIIGAEIENPFGEDVNDLPLDSFCEQIRQDIDILMCQEPKAAERFVVNDSNALLYPLNGLGFHALKTRTPEDVRAMLRAKPDATFSHHASES